MSLAENINRYSILALIAGIALIFGIFIIKGTILQGNIFYFKAFYFAIFFVIFIAVSVLVSFQTVVYFVVFLSFFNIPMESLYTCSTNLLIFFLIFLYIIKKSVGEQTRFEMQRVKSCGIILPFIAIIFSYIISLLFIERGWQEHLSFIQNIVCAFVLVMFIVGLINNEKKLNLLFKVLLFTLVINIIYSSLLLFFPHIDSVRAEVFSLYNFTGESGSRLQGLSFRSESYGEYLMICSMVITSLILLGRWNATKTAGLCILNGITIIMLFLTRLRGPSLLVLFGIFILITFYFGKDYLKKIKYYLAFLLFLSVALICIETFGPEVTILKRLTRFFDSSNYVGYIPEDRYLTWVPAFEHAKKNYFLGTGPSLVPYVRSVESWKEVSDYMGKKDIFGWPHNVIILLLCTVGFYGLSAYTFLLFRIISLRSVISSLNRPVKIFYQGLFLSFILLIIEFQKYDGVLRTGNETLYMTAIIIGILFTCKNFSQNEHNI
jgi:hypothetical protein